MCLQCVCTSACPVACRAHLRAAPPGAGSASSQPGTFPRNVCCHLGPPCMPHASRKARIMSIRGVEAPLHERTVAGGSSFIGLGSAAPKRRPRHRRGEHHELSRPKAAPGGTLRKGLLRCPIKGCARCGTFPRTRAAPGFRAIALRCPSALLQR